MVQNKRPIQVVLAFCFVPSRSAKARVGYTACEESLVHLYINLDEPGITAQLCCGSR